MSTMINGATNPTTPKAIFLVFDTVNMRYVSDYRSNSYNKRKALFVRERDASELVETLNNGSDRYCVRALYGTFLK